MLKKYGIYVEEQNWPVLYNFASDRNGKIDFKFMIDIFKQRLDHLEAHPNINEVESD